MKKTLKLTLAAVALSLLSACDRIVGASTSAERADTAYRAAMAAYTAGHLDEAIAGLKKVIAAMPNNASARFQLACLMQDHAKDYLEAIRHYREFLMLSSGSDRAGLAAERMENCERLLAPVLAKKMKITDIAAMQERINEEKRERAKAELEVDRLTKELAKAEQALVASRAENQRSLELVKAMGEEEPIAKPNVKIDEKSLLENDNDGVDPDKLKDEVAVLVAEEKSEDVSTPFEKSERKAEEPKAAPQGPSHPDTYVVQEGYTLYKIALRFYGRISAWKEIREANKAFISTDGRVNAGVKLKLP